MESAVKYGQEHGRNLIRLSKKLLENQNLLKLLINTDLDPLNEEKHPDVIDGTTLMNKNIKFVPLLTPEEANTSSKVIIYYSQGQINSSNFDNENMSLSINIYCPFKEWLIAGDTLRPFAIMSEIRKSLQDKRINGLGEIVYYGFSISTLTEEMGCYSMEFRINAFS